MVKKSSSKASLKTQASYFKSRWINEPLTLVYYFSLYTVEAILVFIQTVKRKRKSVLAVILAPLISIIWAWNIEGKHLQVIKYVENLTRWYGGWIMLGIASSIGLGTGLHTFMLFLGPFIARTTITAANCGNLDFEIQGPER
jgi:hypothetical protein